MVKMDERIWKLSDDGTAWEMREEVAVKYRAASWRQLKDWVAGQATHTDELKVEGLDALVECCPDFSCCGVQMWPQEMREAFVKADDETRGQMCMMSLSGLAATQTDENDKPVAYVLGVDHGTLH